ncbi:hypothetical protein L1987_36545 [Smallanthus sonchifolius]|uniref:Uncharacterized protein n=1 Tax=Smallanthus sonchifolius TaxID=185202 RepID=A0ACB9HEC8_9ASTR|nr:hypothetical protein L1987_36545 [Smallanthus sonchifolius]
MVTCNSYSYDLKVYTLCFGYLQFTVMSACIFHLISPECKTYSLVVRDSKLKALWSSEFGHLVLLRECTRGIPISSSLASSGMVPPHPGHSILMLCTPRPFHPDALHKPASDFIISGIII